MGSLGRSWTTLDFGPKCFYQSAKPKKIWAKCSVLVFHPSSHSSAQVGIDHEWSPRLQPSTPTRSRDRERRHQPRLPMPARPPSPPCGPPLPTPHPWPRRLRSSWLRQSAGGQRWALHATAHQRTREPTGCGHPVRTTGCPTAGPCLAAPCWQVTRSVLLICSQSPDPSHPTQGSFGQGEFHRELFQMVRCYMN